MPRLGRLGLSDRYFFVTCNVRPSRRARGESDSGRRASSLARRRDNHGFDLTASVLLPGHRHAFLYPYHPLAISALLKGGSHGMIFMPWVLRQRDQKPTAQQRRRGYLLRAAARSL